MKRYLIYGFLTILIITLNFAFIIVLMTDNVRINYRVLFLLWILVLLAAGGLAYLEKTRKNRQKAASVAPGATPPEDKTQNSGEKKAPSNIYKNKCIKKTTIKLPEDLTTKVTAGFFGGYVMNEDYASETVQAVYTNGDLLLGFINKKQEQLCENLQLIYNEPVICWGTLFWDDYEKRFIADVYIPVLYSEPETNRFKKLVKLKEDIIKIQSASENSNIYTLLEKAESFHYLQQTEVAHPSLNHSVDEEILPQLSKELEKKKQWHELVQLKKYPILIGHLPQTSKKEVLSSIKRAEMKLEN